MSRRTKVRLFWLAVFAAAILFAFIWAPMGLVILGLPWSIGVTMLGMLIIHAGSGNALDWALLLSTVPNVVLFLRSILLGHISESIAVEE